MMLFQQRRAAMQTWLVIFVGVVSCFISLQANPLQQKKKVGFYLGHFCVRGTDVSTYDYADCNESILGNESFVFFVNELNIPSEGAIDFPKSVEEKFQKRFKDRLYQCTSFEEVEAIIAREKIDVLYNQKSGEVDRNLSKVCKNAVHAVFSLGAHGDVFASISQTLSDQNPTLAVPAVPYMIRLADNLETLHEELHIPRGAVVFGRHGGYSTFDLAMAQEAVTELAQLHPDWFFLFLNTAPFCRLSNVIFLPGTADMVYKTKFINTCDAMIHARSDGETFGLACGEFSIKNKPVITCIACKAPKAHINILGNKGFYYQDKESLKDILLSCAKNIEGIRQSHWDAYSEQYNPKAVMKRFEEVFLSSLQKPKMAIHQAIHPAILQRMFKDFQEDAEVIKCVHAFPLSDYVIYPIGEYLKDHDYYCMEKTPLDFAKIQCIQSAGKNVSLLQSLFAQYSVPGSIAIDMESRFGVHALALSKFVKEGTVHAFEPKAQLLVEHVMNMYLNNRTNIVHHRLDPLKSLDSHHFTNVSILRMSVNANGKSLIEGAKQTILSNRPAVFVEVQDSLDEENVEDALKGLGYHGIKVAEDHYLFLPNPKQ